MKSGITHFMRPRVFAYCFIVLAMFSAFVYTIATRSPLGVDVIRDRGARLYRISGNNVQNVYTIKISNMDRNAHRYAIRLESDYPFKIESYRPFEVLEGEVFSMPLRVSIPRKALEVEKAEVKFFIQSLADESISAAEVTNFIGPAKK